MRRAVVAGVLAACAAAGGCARGAGQPTNLLLVTFDSVRAEQFAEPERFSELPLALATFAGEATRFAGCIASAPGTLPAAASILTGRHPRELGHPAPGRVLPDGVPTLAELLARAGFETAAFVAPASLAPESGIARGFAHYSSPEDLRDEDYEVTDRARNWLREEAPRARPWFVWVHLNAAHGPYRALETAFGPLDFFYRSHVPPVSDGSRARDGKLALAKGNSGVGGVPEYQHVTSPALMGDYAKYYDARARVGDWFANELRHVLKVTDRYADTVIAVCGTHGEALGEHDVFFQHGENLFGEVLAVPLFVSVPGRAPGVVATTVSHVDLFPTLLGALGVESSESSGRDLFAGGSGTAWSELYPPLGPEVAVAATRGARKLVSSDGATLVFDLARDPGEEHGSAAQHGDELVEALRAFEALPVRAVETHALDADARARLRGLGYVLTRFEP